MKTWWENLSEADQTVLSFTAWYIGLILLGVTVYFLFNIT